MNNELYHYGVQGMRWGKRKKQLKQEYESRKKKANEKWQKEYGSLEDQYTYGKKTNAKLNAKLDKQMNRADKTYNNEMSKAKSDYKQGKANLKAEKKAYYKTPEGKKSLRKKRLLGVAAGVGVTLAAQRAMANKYYRSQGIDPKVARGIRKVAKMFGN